MSPSRRLGRAVLPVVVVAVAACGSELAPSPTPTIAPAPTPTVTVYQLGTSVWYSGLVMTFGNATANLDSHGGTVALGLQLQNPTANDLTLDVPIELVVGSDTFEPTRATVLPTIAAGTTGYTTLRFDVVGHASVDDGVLRIGAGDRHQAIVPLAPGSVDAQTLQPVSIKASGTATAGSLRLSLTGAEVRWDLPDWGDELPATSAALTLTYSVAYIGTFGGGFAFTGGNIALTLPNGTTIGPRDDGRSQTISLLMPKGVLRGAMTRFEIPAGLAGTYVLQVHASPYKATLKFTLPALPSPLPPSAPPPSASPAPSPGPGASPGTLPS